VINSRSELYASSSPSSALAIRTEGGHEAMGALRGTQCACPEDDPDDVRRCSNGIVDLLFVPDGLRAYDKPEGYTGLTCAGSFDMLSYAASQSDSTLSSVSPSSSSVTSDHEVEDAEDEETDGYARR